MNGGQSISRWQLRCVNAGDFMTADWIQLPYEILGTISTRTINEVKGATGLLRNQQQAVGND